LTDNYSRRIVRDVDDRIQLLTASIRDATQAGEWETVRQLNASLQDMMHRRLPEHNRLIGKGVSTTTIDKSPRISRRLIMAMIGDTRFGSLRAYADQRGINRASLSAYATGRTPCPPDVAAQVKRDFPDLDWEWPAGVSKRRPARIGQAAKKYREGEWDIKTAAQAAGVTPAKLLEMIDK
jgi:hypothetical protein